MIEPSYLSVPELADRWDQTTRQVLEHALALHLPVLFPFDGLAFDQEDRWLMGHGAADEQRELEQKREWVASSETLLKRNAAGLTGEFDRLDRTGVLDLRSQITEANKRITLLAELLERRDRARLKHQHRGYMRALLDTVWTILQNGDASFPGLAMHLDGRLVRLEPGLSGHWHSKLSAADLLVPMATIKGLEGGSGDIREAQSPALRRDLMASVIEQAQKRCDNAEDASAVWVKLVDMANKGLPPLIGVSEDGIKWLDGNDQPQFLTLKNLRDRLRRRKAR